LIHCIN